MIDRRRSSGASKRAIPMYAGTSAVERNVTKQQPIHFEMEGGWWPREARGPMLVVSLDDDPDAPKDVGPGQLYLLDGRLWVWEEPGCAICNEEGASSVTLHTVDESACRCLQHGELVEVPYRMKRRLDITIGPIRRTSTEEIRDSMLFPASLDEEELRLAVEQMLGTGSDEALESEALSQDSD